MGRESLFAAWRLKVAGPAFIFGGARAAEAETADRARDEAAEFAYARNQNGQALVADAALRFAEASESII